MQNQMNMITGTLRVAKESIFSGLNNLVVHSVIDEKYSAYFFARLLNIIYRILAINDDSIYIYAKR